MGGGEDKGASIQPRLLLLLSSIEEITMFLTGSPTVNPKAQPTPKGWQAPFSLPQGSSEFSGVTKATSFTTETAWLQTRAVKPSPFEACKAPPLYLPPQGPYYLLSVCISTALITLIKFCPKDKLPTLPFYPTPESFPKGLV